MYQFDENVMSRENVKRLIKIYQNIQETFPKIKWGETDIVINPIVAKEFGLVDGQSVDTFCFMGIIEFMNESLMIEQFDKIQPSDFEEDA